MRYLLVILWMVLAFSSDAKMVCDKNWYDDEMVCQEWPDDDAVKVDEKHQIPNPPKSNTQIIICEYNDWEILVCNQI